MTKMIRLRDVTENDLSIFFEQQHDPVANLMAAFPARTKDAFITHWTTKILCDEAALKKTILFGEAVAGNILSWQPDDKRLVGYWIGKEYWGKGIATKALAEFLSLYKMRPLYAHVAKHNAGSIRVLEKSGFTISSHGTIFSTVHGHEVEDILMVCT